MKTFATITTISVLALAAQVSASPLNMRIYTVDNSARISITQDGHPVAGVPISVKETASPSRTIKTSEQGVVTIRNYNDRNTTYTFSVQQDDGSITTTKRLLEGNN